MGLAGKRWFFIEPLRGSGCGFGVEVILISINIIDKT